MALTDEQVAEFDSYPFPSPCGEQTQAQAENFAVSSYRYICSLFGPGPIPTEADVWAYLEERRPR